MIKSFQIILLSIIIVGCAHTIKPNDNIQPFYDRIENISIKRKAIINYYQEEKSSKIQINIKARNISINQDSIQFYCIGNNEKLVLSTKQVNYIIFNSGIDGGVEGIFYGAFIGLCITFSEMIFNTNKNSCEGCSVKSFLYYGTIFKIPIYIIPGYFVGRAIGTYKFIIN